jgi:cellulose synthase operon protein C
MAKLRWGRTQAQRSIPVLAALISVWCLNPPHPAFSQAPNRPATRFYPDSSENAETLLRNAAGHARDGQWGEAIDIYQRVIQQFGDKVAKLPRDDPAGDPGAESVLFVDLRQFCQRSLAALPAEARAVYRGRVDAQAERWYRQGAERRDRSLLRRVVEQAFCSSWGDDALDLLGDLAFEDGRFDEALSHYRRLVADRPNDRTGLVHPDPGVDLARVAAKKLLCRAAMGEAPDRAAVEALAASYPGAKGSLAGRSGPYAEIVAESLKADHLAPPAGPDGRWPTFAGAPTRTKVVPGPIDVGSMQWQVPLDPYDPSNRIRHGGFGGGRMARIPMPTRPVEENRLLRYHPIVLGDQVVVCDENKIFAYDLNGRPEGQPGAPSGSIREAWKHDEQSDGPQAASPFATLDRFTLTAFGDRIYARMGPTPTQVFWMRGGIGGGATTPNAIVAVDRGTDGKLLWARKASEVPLPKRPAADATTRGVGFEGTPVADASGVYVAMTDRRELTATYVVCLDAETGAPRWVRYLGAASTDADNIGGFGGFGGMGMGGMSPILNDFGHRLLSLDGPTVYYQTNLGAVAALDAETGSIRWVATYPRLDRDGGAAHDRDLNPAIVHDGRVIVAPDDAPAIYAFDAASGRLVWKTDPIPDEVKLAHLLGVAKGRLVATGNRVLLFDVKDGKLVRSWPDGGTALEGYGRGLLAGDKIYWPTRDEIHVLDQATGLRSEPPIRLQATFQTGGGNLAVGDGFLIVAQADALVVFCQNSRLIQRYRDEIARAPDQAANYYRLAQAAEATGQDELALESLGDAMARARPSETIDGQPMPEATRDHRYRLLVKLAGKARAAKDWETAVRRLEEASSSARSGRDQLSARLTLADVLLERGAPRLAVETLQDLLASDRLRPLSVAAEDGRRTTRADLLIRDRLATILRDHGRGLYADFDRAARELLERGKRDGDPRPLVEVGRIYPVAEVVPDALLALGRVSEDDKRFAEAARAYRRLMVEAPSDAYRARALVGLARAYEAQNLLVPARETYEKARTRFGEVTLEEFGSQTRLASLIQERLSRPPFDRMMGDHGAPSLPVPMVRRWGRSLSGGARTLAAQGVPPSAEASRMFLAEGDRLLAVNPATGETPWTADLDGAPTWVGYLADKVIAATDSRIVALSLDDGTPVWQHDPDAPRPGRGGDDPFARGDAGPRPNEAAAGRYHGFQVVGGRVVCLRGDRELLALDGDTGLADWSFAPSSGTINPNLSIGPQRVVLQVRRPSAILVLETATGRRRAEFPRPDDEEWARHPLPIDDDHVALVTDRRTVALFDVVRGVESWVFRESRELPKNGAPRLVGDAERLLVIHDGSEVIRLDPSTGVKRWSRPLGAENLAERPGAFAIDHDRFYWANGRTLGAVRLSDGVPSWSQALFGPESGWSIALTERFVLAYPAAPGAEQGDDTEGLPLIVRDRETGRLVQRLQFPVAPSDVAVRLSPRGALVAATGGLWALGERPAPIPSPK